MRGGLEDFGWMNRDNLWESLEIAMIQGQDVPNTVHFHDRRQPCIVNLDTLHPMR